MPRGRGGRRQGTPGKSYTNRTDLAADYAEPTAENTPASGGVHPVNTPAAAPAGPPQIPVYPEQIPTLTDPTTRPDEPLLAPGTPGIAGDETTNVLFEAYRMFGTEQLRRALLIMQARNGPR